MFRSVFVGGERGAKRPCLRRFRMLANGAGVNTAGKVSARHNPREEPRAVVPLAGICAGVTGVPTAKDSNSNAISSCIHRLP